MEMVLKIVGISALFACLVAVVVLSVLMWRTSNYLYYNEHSGKLLNKLRDKNEMVSTTQSWDLLNQIQIKSDNVYTLKDIRWFLQEANENEFLDNLPKEPCKEFVYLDFKSDEMYKVLYTASKMFGDDCLKYGTNNNNVQCNGIGISFAHAIHAYASILKKQNGYYKKYRLLI